MLVEQVQRVVTRGAQLPGRGEQRRGAALLRLRDLGVGTGRCGGPRIASAEASVGVRRAGQGVAVVLSGMLTPLREALPWMPPMIPLRPSMPLTSPFCSWLTRR